MHLTELRNKLAAAAQRQPVTVLLKNGGRAQVLGVAVGEASTPLVMHPNVRGAGWTLTHAPSGWAVVRGLRDREDAEHIGRWLLENCPMAVEKQTALACKLALPENVKSWLLDCARAGVMVEHVNEPERSER